MFRIESHPHNLQHQQVINFHLKHMFECRKFNTSLLYNEVLLALFDYTGYGYSIISALSVAGNFNSQEMAP